jgi:succinate dehydrogenase / fumarate reductase cytochrome b subunit
MFGGLRHFIWDTGRGFSEASRMALSRWSLVGSIVLTILLWVIAYWAKGSL